MSTDEQRGADGRRTSRDGHAPVHEFCCPVEQIVGRKVRAFLSAIDTEADGLVTEIFVLHPPGYEGPSRTEESGP